MADTALDEPFQITNRNPFVQLYGIPDARAANVVQVGSYRVGIGVERANSSSDSSKSEESILIDGETSRTALNVAFGLEGGFELWAKLPYYSHSGGSLDSFIENWHDVFGLPNGNRDELDQDQLAYRYLDEDGLIGITEDAQGLGDVSVGVAYALPSKQSRRYLLQAQLKLPTGDVDELTGTEAVDLAAGFYFTDSQWLQSQRWQFHGSAGLLWQGDGDLIEERSRNAIAFGSSAIVWKYTQRISLKAQLDLHSAAYDSELRELGYGSAQLSLGGTIKVASQWFVDINVNEDIAVRTSPDVVFQMGVKYMPSQ